ncbi:organic cation transporter protein-like [Dermacentor andersoni]|uniref:organic cation transporter protein-like n=1 Tax=Dermacentor andersoni TaxID=34620 RepID=UPI00215518F1
MAQRARPASQLESPREAFRRSSRTSGEASKLSRKEESKARRKEAAKTPSEMVPTSNKGTSHEPDESEAAVLSSGGLTGASRSSSLVVPESVYAVMEHGWYQRRLLLCGVLGATAVFMEALAYRLIARRVDHWCQPPGELAYLSDDAWKNLSIPVDPDGNFSRCTVYSTDELETSPENRTVIGCHKWDYELHDRADSIVSRFDLVCGREALYELSERLPPLAYALLSPAAGFAADRVGRKPVAWMCGSVVLISAVGSGAAVNYAFFLANRIVLLASGSATYLLTFVLIYEATGNARRWPYTLLHSAVAFTLVPPFLHVLSLLEPSWALTHAIFIVPTTAFTVWCFLLDESPVWLLATWRLQEAEARVLAAAKLNGVDEDKARENFRALRGPMRKLGRSYDPAAVLSVSDGILDGATMRRRMAAVFFARFTLSGIYFSVMFTDHARGLYWQAFHVAFCVTSYSLVIWAMNRLGLRDTLSALLAATCITAVAKAVVEYASYDDTAAAYLHAAMKILASGSMSVVLCYAGEIFPTTIRGTGVGLSVFVGGIGFLLGEFFIRVRTVRPGFVFDVFYSGMTLLSIVAIQWLPKLFIEKVEETRPTLPTSPEGRKMQLMASLSPTGKSKERKKRDSKAKAGRRSLP